MKKLKKRHFWIIGKNHYKEVHANFLESTISEPKLSDFYYPNPGVILMLCYGLIVYPLEFWKKQVQINYEFLEKQIIEDAHNLALAVGVSGAV